jgi:hypothetical protein
MKLSLDSKYIKFIAILFSAIILLTWAVYRFLPVNRNLSNFGSLSIGVDWKGTFRPATLALISGQSPYDYGVFNPPWAFLPLIPVALLYPELGEAVMLVIGLLAFGFAAYRLKAPPWMAVMMMINPWTLSNAGNGNIDWMVAIGATLPPQIGLFFVLTKPQLGIGLALFWLVQAWDRGKLREVLRVFAPVTIALMISFIPYGFWPLKTMLLTGDIWWNGSLWPVGLIVGVALLVYALHRRSFPVSIISSPFLSKYLTIHGWNIALFGLLPFRYEFIAAWIAIWLLKLLGLM